MWTKTFSRGNGLYWTCMPICVFTFVLQALATIALVPHAISRFDRVPMIEHVLTGIVVAALVANAAALYALETKVRYMLAPLEPGSRRATLMAMSWFGLSLLLNAMFVAAFHAGVA